MGHQQALNNGRRPLLQDDAEAAAPPPPPHATAAAEALLLPAAPVAAAAAHAAGTTFPWLTALGFAFLTFNSGMAIYRSDGEPGAVGFVLFSYADLVLLYGCLRRYEAADPGSVARGRLKAAVWLLTTALTLLFSTKVAAVMPPVVAVVVWVMAFATVSGGFYAFFCHSTDDDKP